MKVSNLLFGAALLAAMSCSAMSFAAPDASKSSAAAEAAASAKKQANQAGAAAEKAGAAAKKAGEAAGKAGEQARGAGEEMRRGGMMMRLEEGFTRSITYKKADGTEVTRFFTVKKGDDGTLKLAEVSAAGGEAAANPVSGEELKWLLSQVGLNAVKAETETPAADANANASANAGGRGASGNRQMPTVIGPDGETYSIRAGRGRGQGSATAPSASGPAGESFVKAEAWMKNESGEYTSMLIRDKDGNSGMPQWGGQRGTAGEGAGAEGAPGRPSRDGAGPGAGNGRGPRRERPQQ